MWVDAIAIGIAGVLAALGFRRGTLASSLKLLTLLASYGLSLVLGAQLGPGLAARVGLPSLLGTAAAGTGVFLLSYLVLTTVSVLLRRRDEEKRHGRSLRDRLGGAALGALQGGLIAVFLGLLATWLDAGRSVAQLTAIPATDGARVTELSRTLIEGAGSAVIADDDATSRVALHLAVRPTETLQAAGALLDRAEMRDLQGDELFWTYLENEQIDSALNSASFLAVSYRREIRQQLADLGMAQRRGVDDPAFFREEMRSMLVALAPRVRALRDDPEVAGLAKDPVVARAIEEGSTTALLAHPGVRRIVQRLFEDPPPAAPAPE